MNTSLAKLIIFSTSDRSLSIVLCKCIDKLRRFHNLEWQKHFNNSDKTCQLRNAIKYDVLFGIAYFNIPENIIQWIILHSLAYQTAYKPKTVV